MQYFPLFTVLDFFLFFFPLQNLALGVLEQQQELTTENIIIPKAQTRPKKQQQTRAHKKTNKQRK